MSTKSISPVDAVFLLAEQPDIPMHVAGLLKFELPDSAGENFIGELVERFRACTVFKRPWNLVLGQKRLYKTLPRLHEVHDADMEYHVRHLALPKPGGERELGQLIASLHGQPLDMSKPLWECHIIEGLEDNRFAIYLKIHHVLVDGVSATRMIMRALSTSATAPAQMPFWATGEEPTPKAAQLQSAKRLLPRPGELFEGMKNAGSMWLLKSTSDGVTLKSAPNSILNGRISPRRRFATYEVELDRLKRIAKAADASLNDVVMTLTGTSLREYLMQLNALPDESLTASVPVSTREINDTSAGNALSMIFASLGTNFADDRSRLEAVKRSTAKAKADLRNMSEGASTFYPAFMFAPLLLASALDAGGRGRPPFNVIVSNIPGSKEEHYLYGAKLLNMYPVNIPMHGMAFSLTCYSYAGTLNFGLTACRDSVPHVQKLAVGLEDAVQRLEIAYGLETKEKGKSKSKLKVA